MKFTVFLLFDIPKLPLNNTAKLLTVLHVTELSNIYLIL